MDKDTFCEYIKLYEKSMYLLAFSIVKNDADANEVISESIYRAFKNLHLLKNNKAFKTWILQIVHNTSVELIRKNSKIIIVYDIPRLTDETTENITLTKLTVQDATNKLKQPYRTVVTLFYFENLSVIKIAQITGCNVFTVKKQLSRARKMLKEILKEDFSI